MTTSAEKAKRKNKPAVVQRRRMLVVLCIGGLLLIGVCLAIGLATGWIKLGLSDFEIQSTNIALTNVPAILWIEPTNDAATAAYIATIAAQGTP